ncbi:hypothetical protein ACT453_35895, partial [Bacillus sp. D-CC]
DTSYRDKIFNIGIEDLDTIKGIKFTKIIIPATTVSLFSEEQFKSFNRIQVLYTNIENLIPVTSVDIFNHFQLWFNPVNIDTFSR